MSSGDIKRIAVVGVHCSHFVIICIFIVKQCIFSITTILTIPYQINNINLHSAYFYVCDISFLLNCLPMQTYFNWFNMCSQVLKVSFLLKLRMLFVENVFALVAVLKQI